MGSSKMTEPKAVKLSVLLTGALLGLMLVAPSGSDAATVHCRPVVKKIYSLNEGPPFYKAKVLIVHGEIGCGEARKLIWRTLSPGGFSGRIDGWDCEAKGFLGPFAEKCSRESPSTGEREVIKSSRPKPCPSCTANKN